MKKQRIHSLVVVALGAALLLTAGCMPRSRGAEQAEGGQSSATTPYYPSGLQDIQLPTGLEPDNDRSLYIDTKSFSGGVRSFTGRIEINSLTDYFKSSMPNHGWDLGGSALYKNVLLAFTKPGKTCMIVISRDAFTLKTVADIYLHEETGGQGAGGRGGIIEERLR